MKNAVFISAGIGNTLLLVPLIKALKKQGKVAAFSTSPFHSHLIFDGFKDKLIDKLIVLDSTAGLLRRTAVFKRRFEHVYMDHFAATRRNFLLSHTNGKKIITPTIPERLPSILQSRIMHLEPDPAVHEATRFMRYLNPDFQDSDLKESMFKLTALPSERLTQRPYITFQPASGNNQSPWKSMSMHRWLPVLNHILEVHDQFDIIVLGDSNEHALHKSLPKHPHVIDAIGKTEMKDLPGLLSEAHLHIGHDSGLMHIAGCVGTPTVTVWGGSDPGFYGWAKINAKKHSIVQMNVNCSPCNRWLQPNTTRVEVPSMCPDFKCLQGISTERITKAIDAHLNS